MLTLLLGTDWIANRDKVLGMIAQDVSNEKTGVVYMVPELVSHDTERRLCAVAGDTASRFAEVLTFTRMAKRVADSAHRARRNAWITAGGWSRWHRLPVSCTAS